jgi:hypothetical protein
MQPACGWYHLQPPYAIMSGATADTTTPALSYPRRSRLAFKRLVLSALAAFLRRYCFSRRLRSAGCNNPTQLAAFTTVRFQLSMLLCSPHGLAFHVTPPSVQPLNCSPMREQALYRHNQPKSYNAPLSDPYMLDPWLSLQPPAHSVLVQIPLSNQPACTAARRIWPL